MYGRSASHCSSILLLVPGPSFSRVHVWHHHCTHEHFPAKTNNAKTLYEWTCTVTHTLGSVLFGVNWRIQCWVCERSKRLSGTLPLTPSSSTTWMLGVSAPPPIMPFTHRAPSTHFIYRFHLNGGKHLAWRNVGERTIENNPTISFEQTADVSTRFHPSVVANEWNFVA